ncbi:MAG: hypothetical protein E7309_09295 [Butyrivibrio sp.]|nr:hypothetical protein [Butyrivibrio sp.]
MGNIEKSKYHQLISNTLLFALGNFGSKFLVFLLVPLYTHALSTEEYGISELVITGINLIIPFVSVSIQDATLRFVLDPNNDNRVILKNTIFMLAIGSVGSCLLYPFFHLYKAIADWSIYFVIITIVYMIRNALSVYVKAIGKSKLFAIDSILYTGILMVTNIVLLVFFEWGLKGYFLATIISTIISIGILCIFGSVVRECIEGKVDFDILKEMLIFSLPMVLNNVSWWIIHSSDKVMVQYFMSTGDSGIYSVSAKMPSIISTITNIFNQAWVISSVSEYDTSRDTNFFTNIFNAFNSVIVIFAALIVSIIKPLMQVYVGNSFASCWQYVPLLLLGSIFQAYATFFGAIYTSAKKNVSVMVTTFIAAIVNIILNAIFIPLIGINGAAIATAVAYFVVFIFRMIDSQKYIKFKIDFYHVVFSMILLTVQSVIVTFDWNQYFVSVICLLGLVLLNRLVLADIIKKTIIKRVLRYSL